MVITQKSLRIWSIVKVSWVRRCSRNGKQMLRHQFSLARALVLHTYIGKIMKINLCHKLSQTPNTTRNEAEFDRSKFSRRTKTTNISQQKPINILKPFIFVCR